MGSRLSGLVVGLGLSLSVGVLPAQAQISDAQVGALVEALRLSAPRTEEKSDRLYSEWQVKPENIPRWSKSCLGRELTPTQFAASPVTARGVISCVVRDVLRAEYRTSGNQEAIAIRRTAAWWMTGNPDQYNTGDMITYTTRVLSLYQQRQPVAARASNLSERPGGQTTAYDRYMQAGYSATKQKDYRTALLYFKRALDERPNDTYAIQAGRNVESYLTGRNRPPTVVASPPAPATPPTTVAPRQQGAPTAQPPISQQQAVDLISRWLQAKAEIFAPPFNQQRVNELTTGELYTSLIRPGGVLTWLKSNQAYYRYGVQKMESVERFVASGDRATIEIKLTEDRTLYANGRIEPQLTDFSAQQIRFSLELHKGTWKITDYKTIDGSLLERSVINSSPSSER